MQLVRREPKNQAAGVLAVADADRTTRQVGDFDTVAIGETQ